MAHTKEEKEALKGIMLVTLFQGLAILFFILINR